MVKKTCLFSGTPSSLIPTFDPKGRACASEYLENDIHKANRLAEAAIEAYAYPEVRVLLDTFMDHDRGYFPRSGIYDRL